MASERWRDIEEIFQTALDLAPEERARYVTRACASDDQLRREVEQLLTQHESAGDFLDEPLYERSGIHELANLLETERDTLIGQRLGAYRIERQIGRGGMGAVYLAERDDNTFQRRVAIKIIKRGMDTDFVLRRFRHERRILAALDHPYIARLLDGGATPTGQPYFVMEYIEGQPLYAYCDIHRLPVRERLHLFSQICEAVDYAHRKQVIHRDIKPSNILVTDGGVPKLFDFGIAKLLDSELGSDTAPETATAMRMMTVEYASPEQVQGLPVTFLSDVYSLGLLLYELLTGHRPYNFRSRLLHDMARVITEEEPEPPSISVTRNNNLMTVAYVSHEAATVGHLCELRGETPESLSHKLSGSLDLITLKALRKEPSQRYASAAELRDDILRYQEGRPVSAPFYLPAQPGRAESAPRSKTDEMSIAVLPFKLMSAHTGDTGDQYLGIGLADALITRLSNVRRLVVRPTSSVLQYSKDGDPLQAGRRLAVDYVVDGSIRRAGETLRITVQLLSVQGEATRWAGKFDEKVTDVLLLEDLISEQVAVALIPKLTGEEQQQLAKRGTNNEQAFEAYLRGRYHFHSLTEEGFAKSLQDYYRAIAFDPEYALAYAGIADYFIFLGIYGIVPFAESSAAAKQAAQRAVELDDTLSEAYAALAFATVCHDFDWRMAEEFHKRAIALNPNSSTAHNWYAFTLMQEARFEEALAEVRRSLELDPVSPLTSMSLAWCYYHWHRLDDALNVYRRVIESEPHFGYGRIVYSWALRCAGHHDEAIAQAKKAVELAGDGQLYLSGLAAAYASAGRVEEARAVLATLDEMSRTRYISPYCLALVYCYLNEKERAFALLEEAVNIGDAWVTWVAVDPQLDCLRSNPRFDELVRRTKTPSAHA
ncbi:MAG TPA: protein kinase [Pyrinomonadaceae bacterium]|jgi:serine/threonine protein kinase/tetratricopeptide (TPR) repeat protein